MLLFREKTGFAGSQGMIKYTTPWDKFATSRDAEILFYPRSLENVVDIGHDENGDVEIFLYPHNRKDLLKFCEDNSTELYHLLKLAEEKYSKKSLFTMDLETKKVIEDEDFTSYRPAKDFKYNMFVFSGANGASTFPFVYVISNQQANGDYKHVFNVQAFTSHYCLKAAGIHTDFGKALTYILACSIERRKFIGDKVPSIDSIQFPTNGRNRIPSFYKTSLMDAFMTKCRTQDVIMTKDDVILLPGPSSDEVAETEVLDNLSYVLSKDEVDNVRDRAIRIQKEVRDKNSILVTDLMAHGVRETFACLPAQDGIIPVNLDIGGIARKMCLFQGKIYVIPVNKKTEWDIYFGADMDSFVECTEETYPAMSYG